MSYEVSIDAALKLVMSRAPSRAPANFVRAARVLANEVQRRLNEDISPVMPFSGRDEVLLITSRGAIYSIASDDPPPAMHTLTDRDLAVGRSLLTLALDRLNRLEPSP